MASGFRWRQIAVVVVAPALGASSALAGDWEVEPRIRDELSYTDNVTLAQDDEESELVNTVTPGLRVTGEGRRASLELDYQAEALFHANDSERNEIIHELGADGSIELMREQLFFDANASRSEDVVAAGESVPDSNVFDTGARDSVTTYGLGPRLEYELGTFAGLRASYRRQGVHQDESDLDTETDTIEARLASGPRFRTWGWSVRFEREDESSEREQGGSARGLGDDDRRFQRVRGELTVGAGRRTELFAAAGNEDNEFQSAQFDEIDGDFWEAGFRWNPRRRVSVEAAIGERFFGDTARASISAQGQALSVRLSYQEELTTESSLRIERSEQLVRDPDGNIILGPEGEPVTTAVPVPTLRDETILEERASARVAWQRGHSAVAFNVVATEREFQESGFTEGSEGVDVSYTWTRLVRTVVSASVGFTEQDLGRVDRSEEFLTVRLGATRDLGSELTASMSLEASQRDTTNGGTDYDATRISAALEKRF